jgi:hypothetical protein
MKSLERGKKLFKLTRDLAKNHSQGLWIGVVSAGVLVAIVGLPDTNETHTIFKREPSLDFKNAEILGNPRQSILQGQETLFSKTQRSVLSSETELKTEVAALRLEVDKLRSQTVASPSPSPMSSRSMEEVYGPWKDGVFAKSGGSTPGPISSTQTPTLGAPAPGVTPGSVVRASDIIRQTQAAPSRDHFGLSEMDGHRSVKLGANMISFPVKSTGRAFLKKPGIILPSGSYVKATLLTGVEAPEGKSYPILLQLDYAYIIPNEKRLDLAGCFIIAKAQGDLSTERVQMQATKLSCVSRRGGMFEREVNGFVADDMDNSFAVVGRVNSKQDRVAATAFLASIVAGIGKAIQQAQTTSQITPLGGSQTVLTGDQGKYIAAGGASDAATMVTQWYLKQAQNLLPTINVGSGQNVWVIMQDQVDLPKDYFIQNSSGGSQNASIYSHFTNLLN